MFPQIKNVTWKFKTEELPNIFSGEIVTQEVISLREKGNFLCGRYDLVGNSDGWTIRIHDNEIRFSKFTYMKREEGIKALLEVCGL